MHLACGRFTASDWTSPPAVVAVLSVPVLQPGQEGEGGPDAALHLPGQHVPAWAAEPLADPFPRRSGVSVFTPDTDEAAAGEAGGLWSVRHGTFDFHRRVICVSLSASQRDLRFPSLEFLSTRLH